MELITITILTLITTTLFLYLLTQHRQNNKLPPGPWNLPIIGSIHHFINSGSLIHVTLRNMARIHGPLMHLKIGELNTIVASSPESAKAIMKTHDVTFATRPLLAGAKILTYGGKDMVYTPYGDYWRQLRKICILELLSAKRVSSFSSIRHEEVHNLIHSLSSSSSSSSSSSDITINVSEKIKSCINNITVGASVGSKWIKDEQMMFLDALNEALDFAAGFGLHDVFPSFSWLLDLVDGYKAKVEACHQKFDCVIDCILQEHKRKKARSSGGEDEVKDLIDVLLKLQEDDSLEFKLTDDCIKAVVLDIVAAGSETSSTVILWAMSELMRNPAAMKTVQKAIRETFKEEPLITEGKIGEAKYLQSVIKETLRLHAPVPLVIPRECRETCNVLGYEIPQGTRAIVNVWAIGRDPEYWVDAEQFKPERFEGSALDFKGNSFEFLPFGSGRRMCPGILFGTVNVELVLANLLYYFDWELPGGVQHHELDMTEQFGATSRRMLDLCLCAKVVIPIPE